MVSQKKPASEAPTSPPDFPKDVKEFIEHLFKEGYAVDHIYKIARTAGENGDLPFPPVREDVREYARWLAKDSEMMQAREEGRAKTESRGLNSAARMWGWLFRLTASEEYRQKIADLYKPKGETEGGDVEAEVEEE